MVRLIFFVLAFFFWFYFSFYFSFLHYFFQFVFFFFVCKLQVTKLAIRDLDADSLEILATGGMATHRKREMVKAATPTAIQTAVTGQPKILERTERVDQWNRLDRFISFFSLFFSYSYITKMKKKSTQFVNFFFIFILLFLFIHFGFGSQETQPQITKLICGWGCCVDRVCTIALTLISFEMTQFLFTFNFNFVLLNS